jgi:hypothetical protein
MRACGYSVSSWLRAKYWWHCHPTTSTNRERSTLVSRCRKRPKSRLSRRNLRRPVRRAGKYGNGRDRFYLRHVYRRYKKESDKDRALETAIEQEIERQRAFENQIAGATGQPVSSEPARLPQQVSQPATPTSTPHPQTASAPGAVTVARASAPPAPPPFRNVEVRDINSDGVPDIWIYYNPQKPGEILRQEEASKGDGRVDSWSYYQDGRMVRRDVDRRGSGRPDSIYYYEKDTIVREERDETGQGRMTYRASYQNGRIEKVEKDSSGQGRPDLWVYYDTSRDGEIVVKEERDLNGDGVADLWSFYDNGRLVRRDVNAPGLEILSKQDQVPQPIAEIRTPVIPGS